MRRVLSRRTTRQRAAPGRGTPRTSGSPVCVTRPRLRSLTQPCLSLPRILFSWTMGRAIDSARVRHARRRRTCARSARSGTVADSAVDRCTRLAVSWRAGCFPGGARYVPLIATR